MKIKQVLRNTVSLDNQIMPTKLSQEDQILIKLVTIKGLTSDFKFKTFFSNC